VTPVAAYQPVPDYHAALRDDLHAYARCAALNYFEHADPDVSGRGAPALETMQQLGATVRRSISPHSCYAVGPPDHRLYRVVRLSPRQLLCQVARLHPRLPHKITGPPASPLRARHVPASTPGDHAEFLAALTESRPIVADTAYPPIPLRHFPAGRLRSLTRPVSLTGLPPSPALRFYQHGLPVSLN